jgi:hypothetical protein
VGRTVSRQALWDRKRGDGDKRNRNVFPVGDHVVINPLCNALVVWLRAGDIPFTEIRSTATRVDAVDPREVREVLPERCGGGVFIIVHGLRGDADDGNIPVVLEEAILFCQKGAEEFRVSASESEGNVERLEVVGGGGEAAEVSNQSG